MPGAARKKLTLMQRIARRLSAGLLWTWLDMFAWGCSREQDRAKVIAAALLLVGGIEVHVFDEQLA